MPFQSGICRLRAVRRSRSQPAPWQNGRLAHEVLEALDGRRDRSWRVSATGALPDITYFGFVPEVTVTAERTESTVARYDTEALSLSFGIRSAF